MDLDGWRRLRPGSTPGVLLAVDFTLAKVRAQANFDDLAHRLPAGPALWCTDGSGWPATGGDPAAHLRQWLNRTRDLTDRADTGDVRGVLGFCAGATLAGALAADLADRGQAPPLVLLDPTEPDAQTMVETCDAAVRNMSAEPGPAPPDTGDLDTLATLLTERYAAAAGPVCAAQGIPSAIAEQLRRRVETNLRYLALSATAGLGHAGAALLVLSRDHEVPARWRGARHVRLDAGQNELLAASGAARAVADALAATIPAERP
jgi:thioesterase domain-containing protein